MADVKQKVMHLEERKKELLKLKNEIYVRKVIFEREIEESRKKFEESLSDLNKQENSILEEFRLAQEDKVTVTLGELLCELASLKEFNPLDIGIAIETNVTYSGSHNLKKIVKFLNKRDNKLQVKPYWQVMLYTNTMKKTDITAEDFVYMFKFDLNLDELQADGRTLLEHCSTQWGYDYRQGEPTTKLVIDKYIGLISCNISISDLISVENAVYDKDRWLLAQAIQNCVERQNGQNKDNIKPIIKQLKLNK